MELIADLHLHSRYSRAVSQQMTAETIGSWAKRKGIGLVAAPDWTHPLFFKELQSQLTETAEGIYVLKSDPVGPKFILSTEISSIYTQLGKSRRIHNLVLAPDFETAGKINQALQNKGFKLMADGRPIISLSAHDLADLVFNINKNCLLIPAHIWTPWYSMFGSQSGFDSLKECFGDLSSQIYAVETGLSSDPAMNWKVADLDRLSIVSFSDAHSPSKLGREATVFKNKAENRKINFNYHDLGSALKKEAGSSWEISYTIEFYPEEGKYHYTGHRHCGVVYTPEETQKLGTVCPVCGKKLTVGVANRTQELSRTGSKPETRFIDKNGVRWIRSEKRVAYVMMVPLIEILSESLKAGVSSKKVIIEYNSLTDKLADEFSILLSVPLKKIEEIAGANTAAAIERVRSGKLVISPGYDGIFGRVKIWGDPVETPVKKQMSLF